MAKDSQTGKTKRRYTVSDKVRDSVRRGNAQARLERQIRPWCANLRHAVVKDKANCSADYASNFATGLHRVIGPAGQVTSTNLAPALSFRTRSMGKTWLCITR